MKKHTSTFRVLTDATASSTQRPRLHRAFALILCLFAMLCVSVPSLAAHRITGAAIRYQPYPNYYDIGGYTTTPYAAAQAYMNKGYCHSSSYQASCQVTKATSAITCNGGCGIYWTAEYTYMWHDPNGQYPDQGPYTGQLSAGSLVGCPTGYYLHMDSQTTYCWADDRTPNINKNKGSCPAGQCCGVGNPIMPAIGNKYQIETDYRSAGAASLTLRRYYNSIGTSPLSSLGVNWRHEYDRSIGIGTAQGQTAAAALDASSSYVFPAPVRQDPNASTSGIAVPMTPSVAVSRADGKVLYFSLLNGKWTADADVADQLVQLTDSTGKITGWQYTASPNDEVETYDANGRLLSITNRAGLTQTLAYDQQGRLNSVTDGFGHALVFAYGASGRLTTVTDPAGGAYQFEYDGPSGNCTSTVCNNLTAVTYPNGSKRIYWYNESSFTGSRNLAHALTGITDENGARFATYTYDVNGNAISTEHAGGIEKYSVAYPQQYAQSTVTDPLGTTRAYNFQTVQGVVRHSGLSQPGGSGCNA
ncbi:MAG TPA: DUF6531 domain-containing protein, partial [Noviherbaspirillum sp.]